MKGVVVRGKGDKPHTVPVAASVRAHLDPAINGARLRPDGRLVPWGDSWARKVVRRLAVAAGLARAAASHDLRSTYATSLLSVTDSRTVQEILGYASLATTEYYLGTSLKRMKDAMEAVA
jgi:integrase/recombinase XerC